MPGLRNLALLIASERILALRLVAVSQVIEVHINCVYIYINIYRYRYNHDIYIQHLHIRMYNILAVLRMVGVMV